MFTRFGSMEICVRLNIEPYGPHLAQDQLALAFEADICTRWRGIPVQWFSKLLIHLFLCISAIDIVILIDVIDLSHQVIELGKDRDDGHCKVLIWDSMKMER